ncbi:MAG: DUF5685 family protein [Oscillospiraceae bacterium]
MFGYALPVKSEMKVKEFEAYRAYYCGLCKQLQVSYGVFSRFLLNYDLVLLALLADSLSGETGCIQCEGCFANPLARRKTCHGTKGLLLAADSLMLLSYHRLCDGLADEKLPKRLLYRLVKPYFAYKYKKAAARRPELAEALARQMQNQFDVESNAAAEADLAGEPTAKMCEALFAATAATPAEKKVLGRMGMFSGQIAYFLDAAEDYEEDRENGRYNVYLKTGRSFAQAVAAAQTRCRMAAGEIALCYNLLTPLQNKPILDNIFFLGLPAAIAAAGQKRRRRNTNHGQIESV